jgi:hypothetical protein
MHWIEQVTTARLRSTPLLWLTSADPGMMRKQLVVALDEAAEAPVPQVQWDILNGLQPLNKTGQDALARLPLPSGGNLKALSTNPTTMLLLVAELPDDSMVLMLQAHRYISKESVAQAQRADARAERPAVGPAPRTAAGRGRHRRAPARHGRVVEDRGGRVHQQ